MSRGVEDAHAHSAHDQELAIVDTHVGGRRRCEPVRDDPSTELAGQLSRRGEVVGVGVGVDDVADAETLLTRERHVAVERVEGWIDDRPDTGGFAAHDVGETAARSHLSNSTNGACRDGGRRQWGL
jgi:hypothetical protein